MQMSGQNSAIASADNRFLYGGKEYQNHSLAGVNINWYDFGARNYDAQLGRWFNIDPLAEKNNVFSPYNYCLNSPLVYHDPDGRDAVRDGNGNWTYTGAEAQYAFQLYRRFEQDGGGNSWDKVGKEFDRMARSRGYDFEEDSFRISFNEEALYVLAMEFSKNYVLQQLSLGNSGSFALGFDYGQIFIAYGTDPDRNQQSYVSGAYDGEAAAAAGVKVENWSGDKLNTGAGTFGAANGLKTELIDWAVRDKAGLNRKQFNKLGAARKAVLQKNAVGSTKYLRYAKGAGAATFVLSSTLSAYQTVDYYANGGTGNAVWIKGALDVTMGAVAFLGPIGFGISTAYFILDAATDGFGGYGNPNKN